MTGFTLLHPWFLLPAALCLILWAMLRMGAGDDWSKVLSAPVLAFLRPGAHARGGRELALPVLALVFAALSGPALPREGAEAYKPTEGLILILDLSRSMTLEDLRPNRLAAARAVAENLLDEAPTRPAALILYAGDSYLAQPFALERAQMRNFLAALKPELIPTEGSDPARALALARGMIERNALSSTRLALLTDGGGLTPASESEVRAIFGLGGRLDVLRMGLPGTAEPAPMDPARLDSLAQAGGGVVLTPDSYGRFDLARLALGAAPRGEFLRLAVTTGGWRNLSHYLLLLTLPLMAILFRRARL